MTEQSNNHPLAESVSALADDEASALELHRLLKASETDPEIKAVWSRYQLIGSAMRRELPAVQVGDLASRISAAIEQEDLYSSESLPAPSEASGEERRRFGGWWQQLGRVAVAASVAVVAVIGVQQFPIESAAPELAGSAPIPSDGEAETREDSPRSAVSLPAGYYAPNLPVARNASAQTGYAPRSSEGRQVLFVPRQTSTPVPVEEIRAQLHQLIEAHSEHAARNTNQGVLPFARIVVEEED